jgi:hypothetical protein
MASGGDAAAKPRINVARMALSLALIMGGCIMNNVVLELIVR